ncbi:MAG TPA: SBBP repeat-containing protein [Candidatus Sulfotelmatobacter sp.]|nr:SBBP repeat-containing protein [Candidatus Sulfotelmatobacter sp.]
MQIKKLALILFLILATVCAAGQSHGGERPAHASINSNYGTLPLTFEANRGQTDPSVKFVSRGPGYAAFLTADGMVLSLRANHTATGDAAVHPSKKATLQLRLLGASKNPSVVGEGPQRGRVNYFIGNDPGKWRRNIPTYDQVRYKNIYPGIDLLYYGNHRQLEYDLAIAPGAEPERIQFEVSGASDMHIDDDGSLILTTGIGEIHFQTPTVYQESKGQRIPVEGGYVVSDPTHVGFRVANYDRNSKLLIDPVLVYSTYLGGSSDDKVSGIAVDTAGSIYVAGSTDSTDFPLPTLGSLPDGNTHVFIAKLDASGSNLIYADYLGGNSQDLGYALALDSANNVYVTGGTASSDFPMVNPFQGTYPGGFDAFLSKISPDGSSLLYSTYFGGSGSNLPLSLAIDGAGEMVIAGYTSSTTLPVANAYQPTVSASQGGIFGNYGFLTKFTADGSSLVYSTYLGGSSNVPLNCGGTPCWEAPVSTINGMVLDPLGNAYVTGTTNTYNFPVTQGSYLTLDSTQDNGSVGFVSKFSSSGGLQYSTYFYDASGFETIPTAIAVDGSGSAYVTGIALTGGMFPETSPNICDPGVYSSACNYAFVTKFDATAATLLYSTFLGPNNNAVPQAIVLDGSNDAYILAYTGSGLFSTVNGIENFSSGNDILLVEIDPAASTQLFATYLGGSGNDRPAPAGMVLDAGGNLYIAGTTDSTDFPVTQHAFQNGLGGQTDGFILKIAPDTLAAVTFSPSYLQYASQMIGTSSQPQTVIVRNVGSAPLSISSITTTGDFSETDNCGTSLSAAGSCTLSITFTPNAAGSRNGTIVIVDDAAGAPHSISLSGSAIGPVVNLNPAGLSFPSTPVGTATAAQTLTLANTGNTILTISSIEVSGDYGQTNNCPASLPAASSCLINVTFTPSVTGVRTGAVTIHTSAAGGPLAVALSGSGSDFRITSSSNGATVKAGIAASYSVTVASVGGTFSNAVKLSCSGAPAKTTCSLSTTSVTPGSSSAAVTVTVNTTANSAQLAMSRSGENHPFYALWMSLPGFGLVGLTVIGTKRRAKTLAALITLFLLLGALLFMSACAGGTGIAPQHQGTIPGTYTITISGTSGSLQHSVPLTLTVQ